MVPVTRPNNATTRITQFLPSINLFGDSDEPHALTSSITGGKIRANPDEQSAPISEMNAFKAGTTSANESEIIGKNCNISIRHLSLACRINCLIDL